MRKNCGKLAKAKKWKEKIRTITKEKIYEKKYRSKKRRLNFVCCHNSCLFLHLHRLAPIIMPHIACNALQIVLNM
jgi:hypothetical protein